MWRVIKTKNLNPKPKTPTWPSIFIRKFYEGKYASEAFWLSFLTERSNQFDFRPDCYKFKDASLDTHIDTTYVCHLSSLTSVIYAIR